MKTKVTIKGPKHNQVMQHEDYFILGVSGDRLEAYSTLRDEEEIMLFLMPFLEYIESKININSDEN